jgi:plastocyanin
MNGRFSMNARKRGLKGIRFCRVRLSAVSALIGLSAGLGIVAELGAVRALSPSVAAAAEMHEVTIDNYTFSPSLLTVPVGTTVTWVNHDDTPHVVVSDDNPRTFRSGGLDTDDKFSFTFTKPGTYKYFCAVHPHMTGMVIVH